MGYRGAGASRSSSRTSRAARPRSALAAFLQTRDEHTLLYTVFGTLTVVPLTMDKVPYDAENDFVPIAPTASVVVVVSVNSGLPVHSLADLERVARARPGQLSWASGPTLPRYAFATFLKQRGLEMTYVGYRNTTQPQADLGEGRIHALITGVTASSAPVALGKSRFLAITEPQRSVVLPAVPTAARVRLRRVDVHRRSRAVRMEGDAGRAAGAHQ